MATVTVYTAERTKAIEDAAIIDGTIVNGHLILKRHDDSEIDAGPVVDIIDATAVTSDPLVTGIGGATDVEAALTALLDDLSNIDSLTLHKAGSETVTGAKTFTQPVVLPGNPTSNLHSATKQYVDVADALSVPLTQRGAPNGIATLDSASKIPGSQLPALAITDSFVVASQAAMLALTAEPGDIAIRSDLSKSFILQASPASTLANWQELLAPAGGVTSVNTRSGAVTGLAEQTSLDAHLNDTVDAHDASAVSFDATGLVVLTGITDVQAALAQIDSAVKPASGLYTNLPAVGTVPEGKSYTATDLDGGTTFKKIAGAWVQTGGSVNGSKVLYDANPAWAHYTNQEVLRVVGDGGAHPCQGTFIPLIANPALTIEMLGRVLGGALCGNTLVIGVRAGNDPTIPIAKPDPYGGTAIAAPGVTEFQHIDLPAFSWEQISAFFSFTVVFGKSRQQTGGVGVTAALVPGRTYIWQIVQTIYSAATTIESNGLNPVTPGISPDYKTVWVPNSGSNTVAPVSLGARPAWVLNGGMKDIFGNPMSWYPVTGSTIAVGAGPYQCRVSPNGVYVAVGNSTAKTVTIINAATKTVIATSAVLAAGPGIKNLAWSSDSTVVWVSQANGTIVPITAATGAVGAAVTVAAGHNMYMTSVGGTTGWVLDLGAAQVFPLSGMTGGAVTVGAPIALPTIGNNLTMSPADGSLWVYRPGNNSLVRITTAGIQSTTVLNTAVVSCTGLSVHPDGSAIWLVDFNAAVLGFDCLGLQQSYYTTGGAVTGAYGVVLSDIDDIIVTLYGAAGLRIWPSSYVDVNGSAGFPANQGVSVNARGVR